MNSISYRIYNDFKGWKLVGIAKKPLDVISLIRDDMKKEKGSYLIIEHDHDINCDNPLKLVHDEVELLELQGILLDVPTGTKEFYKK